MPHQCVRCSKIYDDGSKEIIKGCHCGGKLFFYLKKEKLKEIQSLKVNLSTLDKKQIEDDVYEIIGEGYDRTQPIILDLESIKVNKPGQYEIDVVSMFRGEPVIIKLEDGKYMIDLEESFRALQSKKKH